MSSNNVRSIKTKLSQYVHFGNVVFTSFWECCFYLMLDQLLFAAMRMGLGLMSMLDDGICCEKGLKCHIYELPPVSYVSTAPSTGDTLPKFPPESEGKSLYGLMQV